jgi:hypothetical protein
MYHSDIIEDAFDYTMDMYKDDPEMPKYEEKLRVIWKYASNIAKWIQNSLQGEKHFMINNNDKIEVRSLFEDTIFEMNEIIEKTWSDKEEKIKKEKEQSQKAEEERKKQLEEAEKKAQKDKEGEFYFSRLILFRRGEKEARH